MKRFVVLLAGMVAGLALAAAGAAAPTISYTVVLQPDHSSIASGGTVTLSVAVVADPLIAPVGQYGVQISSYSDAQCSVGAKDVGYVTTRSDGTADAPVPLSGFGTYYFGATVADGDLQGLYSHCVAVTVGQPGMETIATSTAGSYLCWNREMTDPVQYADYVADQMWATGSYFEPQAILGNVAGGTNLGAYHLVCNAPATMQETSLGIGGSGELLSAETMAQYHAAHPGGNDLNVYHIWK